MCQPPLRLVAIGKYLGVSSTSAVVDFGCGRGEMVCLWANLFGASGLGVDKDASFVAAASAHADSWGIRDRARFICTDARNYGVVDATVDVAACLGASMAFGGFEVGYYARATQDEWARYVFGSRRVEMEQFVAMPAGVEREDRPARLRRWQDMYLRYRQHWQGMGILTLHAAWRSVSRVGVPRDEYARAFVQTTAAAQHGVAVASRRLGVNMAIPRQEGRSSPRSPCCVPDRGEAIASPGALYPGGPARRLPHGWRTIFPLVDSARVAVVETSEFPPSVVERLGYYVYALRDPRTDAVFYIGKGTANRVFAHARSELQDFRDTDKLLQIREIRAAGLLVRYEILRHGLTEKEALEVEAALIDFVGLTDLTNEVVGHGTDRRGRMTVNDLVATYRAEAITPTEPLVLIIINRLYRPNTTPEQLYETTRGNWILGPRRQDAKYAFAVYRGLVREVFRIHRWEPTEEKRRWRFNGTVANDMRRYIGGDVSSYIKRGSQSPVLYLNC